MARFGPDYATPIERLRRSGIPLERDAISKRGVPASAPLTLFAERVLSEPTRRDTHVYCLVEERDREYRLLPSEANMSLELEAGKARVYERADGGVFEMPRAGFFKVARPKENGGFEFVPALMKLTMAQVKGVLSSGQKDFDVYAITQGGNGEIFAVRNFVELPELVKASAQFFLGRREELEFSFLCWLGSVKKDAA